MSICKQLIELLNGSIEVDSQKGIGTTVRVTLPCKKGTHASLPRKETGKLSADILSGKRILVTDDNEMNRLVATTLLKNYGAVVDEAQNGIEAIEKLKTQSFDLVLMDVQMPVMDGIEATRLIRENINKNLPIIALTALALQSDESKFFKAGMNDYLSKPFQENQLIAVTAKWLNKSVIEVKDELSPSEETFLYSLKSIHDIAKGNQAFVDKITDMFIEQGPELVKEIIDAHAANDFTKVNRAAHKLKPTINTLCISSLKKKIAEIESASEIRQQTREFATIIKKLKDVIDKVVGELELLQSQC
jgi:CheY-like chemotaxis protein/HPt (histidine-containing phosphotransfer) domain-containing protein